ncbi:threonine--tRNA ligase [Patescibacteria group bacterium]|nr:threonine--tRNA ligase [Patescibacteria group bacterium]MBU2460223.1 threonine--tRNA ligase [Patescibacteria group bacterium]MBU2543974.1 threonine--tRNA ligase [Patescibacteria group bacterium]
MSKILDEKLQKRSIEERELWALRHTAEHVLHTAMQNLYPKLKKAMGPATEEGFYHDCDVDVKISEDNFPKIEKEMQKLIDADLPMTQEYVSAEKARELFKDNQYKLEWIDDIVKRGDKISLYEMGDVDVDLCSGPHLSSTGQIKAYTLLSVAGAYWHGDEKNKMLTRIYGTCFATQKELDEYLRLLEEAKKRDHRKLGQQLGLYVLTNEVGSGLVLWAPKGAIVRREIENLIYEEQTKRGYQHVYTPHIGKKQLWQTSGHWDLYRDKMYAPMKIDDDEYLVKPMNCPFHMMIYKSQPRSYRDLPLRIAEIASVYRYEKPGELSGMLRVRYITQDDAHIFCTEDQVVDEFIGVFDYMAFLLKTFGLTNYYLRLGLRSPKEKYLGDDVVWKKAEDEIIKAIEKKDLVYERSEGNAAFYGPKLDVIVKDVLGREWQCGTIQVDFMLPDRFGLEYIDQSGKPKRPVLIHRAPLGSLERWMAILIEHYAGALPLWLSPVQVVVIPIAERHNETAGKIVEALRSAQIRAEIDDRNDTMQAKIRNHTLQKVPYMAIIGDRERVSDQIAVRTRSGKDLKTMYLEKFLGRLRKEIESKS